MLIDQYKRRFTYLRLSVTDQCNFRCNYCLPDGYCKTGKVDYLNLDEIAALVAAFAKAGTRKIRLTGGEPSLRKDLCDIIRICKQTPGIEKVALTTNGYHLDRQIDGFLEAGLDALNVSVDSLHPDSFRLITGHDKLNQVLRGIDLALEKGLGRVKLNAVLMKSFNAPQLDSFLDYVKYKPVSLRLIELMETGDNGEFFNAEHVNSQNIKQQLLADGWVTQARRPDDGPATEFVHPDYAGRFGLIMPYSKGFCDQCNRLRVTSLGNLGLCLFADNNLNLRPLLQTLDSRQLAGHLHQLLSGKKESHLLQQHNCGSTRNLSQYGG